MLEFINETHFIFTPDAADDWKRDMVIDEFTKLINDSWLATYDDFELFVLRHYPAYYADVMNANKEKFREQIAEKNIRRGKLEKSLPRLSFQNSVKQAAET